MLPNQNKRRSGFTLVEVMVVVVIIGLLATLALPNFLRARKRSQATTVLEDLRIIDQAKDQYALEWGLRGTASITWTNLKGYVKQTSPLYLRDGTDIFGNAYVVGTVDGSTLADAATYTEFEDLALGTQFWGGFYR